MRQMQSEMMAKQMGRQKQLAMQQRQMMMASQVAMGRERLRYQCYFYCTLFTILPIAAFKTKNPKLLFPFVPISCIISFQYDMLYGNMNIRVQKEAARLIREEPERFYLPEGNGLLAEQEYK